MACFEHELHEYVVAAEREVLAEEVARLDVDLPAVTIEGEVYRQVVRCEESYTSAAAPVRVRENGSPPCGSHACRKSIRPRSRIHSAKRSQRCWGNDPISPWSRSPRGEGQLELPRYCAPAGPGDHRFLSCL